MTYDGYCRMKRRVRNVIAVLVLLVIAVGIVLIIHFVLPEVKSCEAIIYNSDRFEVSSDFLKENETSSNECAFVISNEEDHEKILSGRIDRVDFDKEILILYLFQDTHSESIPYWLTDVKVRGKVLRIDITLHQTPNVEDNTVPEYQRSIVVRMKKEVFETVKVYKVTKNTNPKNAFLYDDVTSYVREGFLEENMTHKVFQTKYGYFDETLKDAYTHIVTNQEEYDEIFTDFIDVDFEKETLIVYVVSSRSLRNYRLTDIVIENGTLKVIYAEQDFPYVSDSVDWYQRCCVLKMDKTEFDTVDFQMVMKFYDVVYEIVDDNE